MNKNSLGHNIKRQLKRYIDRILHNSPKPQERFIYDMVFGIIKSGDCKVSSIGRALDEQQELCHTIKRLYNNVNGHNYTSAIDDVLISSHPAFSEETIISLDFSDITKPYAQKMEHLSSVRDGDKGTFGLGYSCRSHWICSC